MTSCGLRKAPTKGNDAGQTTVFSLSAFKTSPASSGTAAAIYCCVATTGPERRWSFLLSRKVQAPEITRAMRKAELSLRLIIVLFQSRLLQQRDPATGGNGHSIGKPQGGGVVHIQFGMRHRSSHGVVLQ